MEKGPTAPISGGDKGNDRPRRPLKVAGVLAVLVIAVAVFAATQGGDEASFNPIAQAAVRTKELPGSKLLFHAASEKGSGSGQVEMSGRGEFNGHTNRSEMTLTAHGPTGDLRMQGITSGTHLYFKSEAFQSELPEDDEWMGLDLSQYAQSDSALPPNSDPSSQLDLLKNVSDEFETLGKKKIHGVQTTGYRGTLDSGLEVETWIDNKELVRRMRIKGGPSDPNALEMTIDFYDFGISPDIKLPDPNTVFDATDLANP